MNIQESLIDLTPKLLNINMSCSIPYWILLLTCMFFCPRLLVARNNDTDRLALLEIKAKIANDPLGVLRSWNDSRHFCDWYGVTCGRRHERVTVLDLHSLKLTGILSSHLGNMSFLRDLYLQNNSFGGTIPPDLSHLQRLRTLWLYNNSIGGEIPSNISGCYSLKDLRLYNNKLVGDIPPMLASLSHLQFLFLGNNNLTGNILSSLGNLSFLSELSLPLNKLDGRISDNLGRLKSLTILNLGANKLSGVVPPSIFNLSLLTELDLSQNDLEGNLPSYLGNTLPHLEWLSISDNRFTGHIPASISNSSKLTLLQLYNNGLQGQVPSLHKLVRLNDLLLFGNYLGHGKADDLNFISSVANATNLEWLEIDQNNFTGVFPHIICNFTSLTLLSFEDNNNIGGHIPMCIEKMAELQHFWARGNALTGDIPHSIGKLQNLIDLELGDNLLHGVIPPSIGNLTKLSILGLYNNGLQGKIPSTLGNCTSLDFLDLHNANLSEKIPPQLFNLPSLSIALALSGNHLIGTLPDEVGQLKNLYALDVSDNMLSGQIPNSLGSCVSLEIMYLWGNNFHGSIPDAFQTLKGLTQLELQYNNLSGKIPRFLASLRLVRLNLSGNNLEGEVPVGGVFSNATGVSLTGNIGLCGGISELKLPPCSFSNNTQRTRPKKHRKILMTAVLSGFLGVIMLLALLVFLYIFWQRKSIKKPINFVESENFPNLSYQTLLKATNGFSSKNIIGRGTFGSVYKGILDEGRSTVAIKVFNLEYRGASKSFMAECGVLRSIRHRNLVKVITTCSSVDYQGRDFKALVYEYMANGSLEDWLHPSETINRVEATKDISRNLNFQKRLEVANDVAFALDYLHHHCGTSIVHCDLKPSNVLLDDEMVAHVSDFGLAKFFLEASNTSHASHSSSVGVRGTVGYAPPEYGMGNEVSTSGDVYSFGILLLEMFTGKRPTDDMFSGGLSLHCYVKEALPEQITTVLDHTLLEDIDNEEETNDSSAEELEPLEALNSIFGIALSCSTDVSRERLDMSDVAAKLSSIRNKLLGTRLQQRRLIQQGKRE